MTRDDDEFDVADGGGREQRQAGGRAYLDMPTGLEVFQSKKKTQPFTIALAAFQVTEAINKFKPDLRFAKPGKWYGEQTFYMHRGIGVNNESFACLAMTCGKPCPVCEDTAHLRNSKDKAEKDRGFEMKPKERQLFLPVDLEETRPTIRLWDEANWNFGKHLYAYIRGAMPDEREAMKQYYNPLQGYEIRVNPQEEPGGKGGKPNILFHVHGMRRMREPLPRELFRHGYDLSAIVRVLDYKTLRDIYQCGAEVSDAPRQDDRASVSVPRDDGWSRPTNGWNTGEAGSQPRQASEAPPRRQPESEPEPQPARRGDRQGWDTTAPAQPAAPRAKAAPAAPAEPAGDDPEFAVGDEVTTYYRKEWHTGPIVEVIASRRLYRVDVGWDQPLSVAFEDAKAVTPAKAAPARRAPDPEPEPEPAAPPRRRAPAPPPEAEEPPPPKPAARRSPPADPQDDAPPARAPQPRRPAVPQDDDLDDPPAPRRRQ